MKKGRYYMHNLGMDVCIYIHNIPYIDEVRTKLKVQWVNLGYTGNPWSISNITNIEIKTEHLENWREIPLSELNSPRKAMLTSGRIK